MRQIEYAHIQWHHRPQLQKLSLTLNDNYDAQLHPFKGDYEVRARIVDYQNSWYSQEEVKLRTVVLYNIQMSVLSLALPLTWSKRLLRHQRYYFQFLVDILLTSASN